MKKTETTSALSNSKFLPSVFIKNTCSSKRAWIIYWSLLMVRVAWTGLARIFMTWVCFLLLLLSVLVFHRTCWTPQVTKSPNNYGKCNMICIRNLNNNTKFVTNEKHRTQTQQHKHTHHFCHINRCHHFCFLCFQRNSVTLATWWHLQGEQCWGFVENFVTFVLATCRGSTLQENKWHVFQQKWGNIHNMI